ncbi:hypothetical protein PCANC_15136 [Puccinia coronata f. sp. avenae]|uniref:E2 ubiquitin-conjugating enzyme n=1 Tax=Puccinia coronata f. sp. avenae TaxID=200324 RepID=A0A2N5SML9_9BASI|nr:hypothetical protein PCANC_15136 [Puccinia coronata f. sp. avenae]
MPPTAPPQTLKRINRELLNIRKELPEGILSIGPKSSDNIYDWQGSISGPSGSCYENGVFHFNIVLPYDYPFHPPRVSFVTRIFHPNINPQGAICLDILTHKWSPALSIQKVLLSIMCLLTDPNPQDPLVGEIARLYLQNRGKFEATAKQWVDMYARPPPPPLAEKPKDEPKRAPLKSSIGKQEKAPIINLDDDDDDDDEVEIVKTGASQPRQMATTSRKRSGESSHALQTTHSSTSRKRSADHSHSLASVSSSHGAAASTSVAPESTSQAKRPRRQVIELD